MSLRNHVAEVGYHKEDTLVVGTGSTTLGMERKKSVRRGHRGEDSHRPADSCHGQGPDSRAGLAAHSTWDDSLEEEAVEDWRMAAPRALATRTRHDALAHAPRRVRAKCHAAHRLEFGA